MNLAVREDRRGAGHRPRAAASGSRSWRSRTGTTAAHAGGAARATSRRSRSTSHEGLRVGRRAPALLPGHRRGRAHHVAARLRLGSAARAERRPRAAGRAPSEPLILAIESSCDETAAAVMRGERRARSPTWSRARSTSTRASAAWCPRSRAASTPRRSSAWSTRRWSGPASAWAAGRRCRSATSTRSRSRTVRDSSARSSWGSRTRRGSRSRPACRSSA